MPTQNYIFVPRGGIPQVVYARMMVKFTHGTASVRLRLQSFAPRLTSRQIIQPDPLKMASASSNMPVIGSLSMHRASGLETSVVPLPTAGPTATIRTASSKLSPFAEVWKLTKLVEEVNACALPGCTIKYEKFLPVMWRAVARGFVSHEHATFVARGLRHGFDAGVQRSKLKGRRARASLKITRARLMPWTKWLVQHRRESRRAKL